MSGAHDGNNRDWDPLCPECEERVSPPAYYCGHCGSELPTEVHPDSEADDGDADRPPGEWGPTVEAPRQSAHDTTQGSAPDNFAHLFGDVYWQKRTFRGGLFYLLAIVLLVPSQRAVVSTVPGLFRWLLVNFPNVFVWVVRHWHALGWMFLVAGVLSHIRLGPEFRR